MADLTVTEALTRGIEAHRSGDLSKAKEYYGAILQVDRSHKHANHNMGVLAVSVGKIEAALSYFEQAIKSDETQTQFWLSYLDALLKLKMTPRAEQVLHRCIQVQGVDRKALETFAANNRISPVSDDVPTDIIRELTDLINKREFAQVVAIGKSTLEKYPRSAKVLILCGVAYASVKQHEMAIRLFKSAIAIEETASSAHVNLAKSQKELLMYDEAMLSFSKALSLTPDDPQIHNDIGVLCGIQGNFEDAISHYKKALKINQSQTGVLYNLAGAYKSLGSIKKAVQSYENCLALDPGFADAHNALGECYFLSREYRKAKEHFAQNSSPYAIAKVLECLYLTKDYDEFDANLLEIAKKETSNIRVAALSSFVYQQRDKEDPYPFCTDPLGLITINNLSNYTSDLQSFLTAVLEELDTVNASWEPQGRTTKAGFQSHPNLFDKPTGNLAVLADMITKELGRFKSKMGADNGRILTKWPNTIKLAAWYVKLLQSGHQDSHIHPSGWVSGVVYLKTVKSPQQNEGAIEFGLQGYDYVKIKDQVPTKLHQPVDGDIVLFPSSLFHRTVPVLQDVERCVIAFDLVGAAVDQRGK